MRVRFNGKGKTYYTEDAVVENRLKYDGEIIVGIDQSKSNTAIVLKDIYGTTRAIVELSGNDKDFFNSPMDTSEFCRELEAFIYLYLYGLNVVAYGYEETITHKKKGKGGKYFTNHNITVTLNEIRSSVIRARDYSCPTAIIMGVNNNTWKSDVLPSKYRTKEYEKGSYDYLCSLDPSWERFNDDVTDADCIAEHVRKEYLRTLRICNRSEEPMFPIEILLLNYKDLKIRVEREVQYNPNFSLMENAAFHNNRYKDPVFMRVRLENLTLGDIYKYRYDVEYNINDLGIAVFRRYD